MHHGYELTLATPTRRFARSLDELNPEIAEHAALLAAVHAELAERPRRRISISLLGFVFVAGVVVGQGLAFT